MPWVYMLRCADGSFYVGSTRDIDRRVDQHRRGIGAVYTKRRLPVELVFAHQDDSVAAAFALEKQIQGWSRAKREALIRGDFAAIAAAGKKRDWAGHRERRRAAEGSDPSVFGPPPLPVVELPPPAVAELPPPPVAE